MLGKLYRVEPRIAVAVLAVGLLALPDQPAQAFSFFGLFGGEKVPAANPASLPYALTFETGTATDVEQALKDASTLYRLRADPPADGEALALRARTEPQRLVDAMWGAGYYNASAAVIVGDHRIGQQQVDTSAVARYAEAFRNRAHVPVRIVVDPGAQFTFRSVTVLDAATGLPFPEDQLPPKVVNLNAGEPARAADILAAEARIIDHFRGAGHPFVKTVSRDPVVFHGQAAMDLTLTIRVGPEAGIGEVSVSGTEKVDPRVVRSYVYTEPGNPYSPDELRDMRKSVGRIEAISSVRIREAESLDALGNLPIALEVTERKPRLIGASAEYSTVDGPALSAYWAHRNLFGGAERLRLDGSLFFAQRGNDTGLPDFGDFGWEDLGGRLSASFLKPALGGSRNDFLLDTTVSREATEGYLASFGNVTAALRHRWTDSFSAQIGPEFEIGQSEDVLTDLTGEALDYNLFGLRAAVTYDSTDNALEPTKGIRATASVGSYFDVFDDSVSMTVGQAKASTYFALDEDARYVLAGRIGIGSITGADIEDIPANRRFFAGGGGSVRGYNYRSLGPQLDGEPLGGLSLLEASVEARIRVTEKIGIVPFIDAGTAFADSLPEFDEDVRFAAGLGLRYYTGIGPIRLDVAVPVNPGEGDPDYAVYIGIGQAF
ncbi:autotransporter assembly complex family protein [Terrihabitans rhizophilus]|uniref:Autotransporter assembly complex family protein n=1 Tax=Terrihabitans rhizophilus TaxID=3092662 RepID=A0ABU4RJI1_9HYPH|nr:autotransporter assembly complex family protein [Terrihabitans sp. PJ23]MDX6804972.1 autotransporter assembly complex family protein [Terrihabitans sp. PJ23]